MVVIPVAMLYEHIIDATGFIALSLNVGAAMASSDRTLRRRSGWASAVWALNNLLIGAQAAAALSVLSVARQAGASALRDHQRRTKAMAFAALVTATLLIGAVTWNGMATAFPVAGSLTATYAMLYMRDVSLRLAMVVVNALWMVNAVAYHSGWQLASAGIAGTAAGIGAWRARRASDFEEGHNPTCAPHALRPLLQGSVVARPYPAARLLWDPAVVLAESSRPRVTGHRPASDLGWQDGAHGLGHRRRQFLRADAHEGIKLIQALSGRPQSRT
jgi:hypothetical protein